MSNFFRLSCTLTGALALLTAAGTTAHALPQYARKEAKGCAYCHTNPKGGGPRNYRGKFYGKNNRTFVGFNDAAEAKKAGVAIGPEPTPPPKSLTPAKAKKKPA